MTPNSLITNPDQVNMRKNSCLTNHPIIFVFSENEFEKIDNHSFYLNISTDSNKEVGVEVFQRKLIGLVAIGTGFTAKNVISYPTECTTPEMVTLK